jgi:hypothetical protein
MKTTLKLFSLLLLCATVFFTACQKDNENGTSTLNVRLTDSPADYNEVNVDVKEIRVKFSSDTSDSNWQTLDTHAGIYNLLNFRDGKDTLIASGTVPSKSIQQIRLILGEKNSVKVNGIVFPLSIPSGAESGLKLMVNKKLNQPVETITMDFDAALSIHEESQGYKLRPVIKIK